MEPVNSCVDFVRHWNCLFPDVRNDKDANEKILGRLLAMSGKGGPPGGQPGPMTFPTGSAGAPGPRGSPDLQVLPDPLDQPDLRSPWMGMLLAFRDRRVFLDVQVCCLPLPPKM